MLEQAIEPITLGERLAARRKELGLDVAAVASACSVTPQSVYLWEGGNTKYLRPENLIAASDVLKTTVRWLVLGRKPKERLAKREELTREEDTLISDCRALPDALKGVVYALAQSLKDQQNPGRSTGEGGQ